MLRMRPFECAEDLRCLEQRIASNRRVAHASPESFALEGAHEFSSAQFPEHLGKHMERAMLMDDSGEMIMDSSSHSGSPIRDDAHRYCTFAPQVHEKLVVSIAKLISWQEYPRDRNASFRIKRHIQRERPFSDHEVLPVEHEDADVLAYGACNQDPGFDLGVLRSLNAPPCGRCAHAPPLTKPPQRCTIQKI